MAAHIGAPARPQPLVAARSSSPKNADELCALLLTTKIGYGRVGWQPSAYGPVSYTHLTLPTKA